MNGRDLTLGLVGALAVGAVLGKRGSRAASPFTTGYCLAFAKVLKKQLGRGAVLYDVVEPDDPRFKTMFLFPGTPHHAVVAWGGLFLDANGAFTEDELLARWNERAPSEIRRPLHLELHNAARAKDQNLKSSCPAYLLWDAENIAKRVEEEARHRLGPKGSRAPTPAPLVLYHGAQRWEGAPEIVAHRKGHAEHGPGIYLTTSYETAARYAKGGGSVYRIELDSGVRWLQDVRLPYAEMVAWVKGLPRLRGKTELLAGLARVSARSGSTLPGEILVNQFVNADAASGQHGPALAAFLVAHGADASHVRQSGEDWVVVFNPRSIRLVTKVPAKQVGAGFVFDLPRVRE